MALNLSVIFLSVIALRLCQALPPILHGKRVTGTLDAFIASESPLALQGVLNNIGPNGSKAPGAGSGIVAASPSTSNPDCKSQESPSEYF